MKGAMKAEYINPFPCIHDLHVQHDVGVRLTRGTPYIKNGSQPSMRSAA